jgi:hypothetical protein
VAIRVASAAAIASAIGPPVGPMVGPSPVAASAAWVAMRDDLTIAASSCSAVASLRGSAGRCTSTVGIGRQLGSSPVVNSHEVSVFCKLGDDFSCAHPLSLACDHCD